MDFEEISHIEKMCFSPEEAASVASIEKRLETFSNHFWLLEHDGRIISVIDGLVTDYEDLTDEMYDNADMHDELGKWQMIFGVETVPEYRHRGYAAELMNYVINECKNQSRAGIVLTCKEELIGFYEQFGYKNEGVSESVHGGAVWYQMRLVLN